MFEVYFCGILRICVFKKPQITRPSWRELLRLWTLWSSDVFGGEKKQKISVWYTEAWGLFLIPSKCQWHQRNCPKASLGRKLLGFRLAFPFRMSSFWFSVQWARHGRSATYRFEAGNHPEEGAILLASSPMRQTAHGPGSFRLWLQGWVLRICEDGKIGAKRKELVLRRLWLVASGSLDL